MPLCVIDYEVFNCRPDNNGAVQIKLVKGVFKEVNL